MEEFVIYLVKSSLLLAVAVALFMLLMSRETFHRLNRFLLLGILVLSLAIPLLNVAADTPMAGFSLILEQLIVEEPHSVVAEPLPVAVASVHGDEFSVPPTAAEHSPQSILAGITPLQWCLFVYFLVVAFLLLRQIYMYVQIARILAKGSRVDASPYTPCKIRMRVHCDDYKPFSWFRWVAISRADLADGGPEIITHEAAHAAAGHSFDILLADAVIIIQWFNPIAWVAKNLLKDIHEFEADEAVIASGADAKQYQLLIIKKAVGARLYSIANSFNHSLTLKRITMMCKKKSSSWSSAKALYIAPVAAVAALMFSSPASVNGKNIPADGDAVVKSSFVNGGVTLAALSTLSADGLETPAQQRSGDKFNESAVNNATDSLKSTDTHIRVTVPLAPAEEISELPNFNGGVAALMKYLSDNIKYPEECRKKQKMGKCHVTFVVCADGSIKNAEIKKSSGEAALDAEAVRAVSSMPAWVPGKDKSGKNVNVQMTLPVQFRLSPGSVPVKFSAPKDSVPLSKLLKDKEILSAKKKLDAQKAIFQARCEEIFENQQALKMELEELNKNAKSDTDIYRKELERIFKENAELNRVLQSLNLAIAEFEEAYTRRVNSLK